MPSQCLALSITKEVISVFSLTALQINKFRESISIYLKINRNYSNSKLFQQQCQKMKTKQKKNKQTNKKNGDKLDLAADTYTEKH